MGERLTAKSERFALNVSKGMTQRAAYLDAYNPTYALEMVDTNASRLMDTTKVSLRIDELRERTVTTTVADVIERNERLSRIIRTELDPKTITAGHVNTAVDIMNKLERRYEPDTINFNDIKILVTRAIDKEDKDAIE